MELYSQTATDSAGNVVNGASVSVTISSSGLPATIYDKDGIALSNPFLTGYNRSAGEVEFQAANDLYDITVTGNGGATKTNQSLLDPSGFAQYSDTTANFTGTLQNGGSNVVVDTDIGSTVQAYNATPEEFSAGIGIGGATAGTGGVAFPVTAVAVSDPNTLDDYEEGTWTPVWKFGATTETTAGVYATYIKVGKMVTVFMRAYITSFSGSGDLTIEGLPFATNSDASNIMATGIWADHFTSSGDGFVVTTMPSSSTLSFYKILSSTTLSAVTLKSTDATSGQTQQIRLQFSYEV